MLIDPAVPSSVLVVMAHPDDAEFSAGGTIARWTSAGAKVTYCICTNGDKGTSDPTMDPVEVARVREREQRAAAAVLGVHDIVFLGHPDGTLQPTLELRRDVVRVIREVRPAALICPDPTRRYGPGFINHPDHRAVGEVALDAVYPSARDPLVFPELAAAGYAPHKVLEIYIANPGEPSCGIDIGPTLETKIAALIEHRSQVTEERLREFLPKRAADIGERFGLAYAEGFTRIELT
ncbi:MAG TPA: PIG-L deacetylase family protein [Candidatus Dormibacteraeota bacterium]|nr:PIG-L deacetylase family protein [Candidatus Dormibacteraeota bacterium]